MLFKQLWEFPVPSTSMCNDVRTIYSGGYMLLYFDYYLREDLTFKDYNSGIFFYGVKACRHNVEMFNHGLYEAYDCLVEIVGSDWVKELQEASRYAVVSGNIKHYAIMLSSNGVYEIAASAYKMMDTNEGELKPFVNSLLDFSAEFWKNRKKK